MSFFRWGEIRFLWLSKMIMICWTKNPFLSKQRSFRQKLVDLEFVIQISVFRWEKIKFEINLAFLLILFSSNIWQFGDFAITMSLSISMRREFQLVDSPKSLFRSEQSLLIETLIFLRLFDREILTHRWCHLLVSEKKWWTWLLDFEATTNINI